MHSFSVMGHKMAVYNKIGKSYDSTRQADPAIVSQLIKHLAPKPGLSYLDIGCGSGNYTEALFKCGFSFTGLDISEEMLEKAKLKNSGIDWICSDAKNMPFPNNSFDGAICILATHHIGDIASAFQEVFRVLRKGHFVIFTSFPKQMQSYWSHHYFPKALQKAQAVMTSYEKITELLYAAGFQNVKYDKFFVTNELKDLFLHAGKYRPSIYLDPIVRAGISTFALAENVDEIVRGCEKLQEDIASGAINDIIKSYESTVGDYAFVVCNKSIYST